MNLSQNLENDVRTLCLEHGRRVGTPGHTEARTLLAERIGELPVIPYGRELELTYEATYPDTRRPMLGVNLVATLPGADRSLPPVLLGAHYDSWLEGPAADDNAAAVAILLALAERLSGHELPRDVVFAFFDAEEPPHYMNGSMGSFRFHDEQMDARGVHCAVVLDLVGHDVPVDELMAQVIGLPMAPPGVSGLRQLLFMTGAESHPELQHVVRAVPRPDRLRLVAAHNQLVGDMSDHGVFRRNGTPYLFLSCGRWQHYHSPTDTPEVLNYDKMARQVQWLEQLVPALAAADLSPVPDAFALTRDPACIADTTQLEIETLREGFGMLLPLVTKIAGVTSLESREDIDQVVRTLASTGL